MDEKLAGVRPAQEAGARPAWARPAEARPALRSSALRSQALVVLLAAIVVLAMGGPVGAAEGPAPSQAADSLEPVSLTLPTGGASVPGIAAAVRSAVASHRLEATYVANVHLDWDTRRVRVRTTLQVQHPGGSPVQRLDLNTVAARLGSLRDLRVRVAGEDVRARLRSQTIQVPLEPALEAGGTVEVRVAFRARLRTSPASRGFFFSKIGGVAQLYRVIPWLSRAIPFTSQGHGEPFLTPVSSSVEVTLTSDRPLVWATSGRRVGRDGRRSQTFRAADVRDFVMIASPGYRITRGRSSDGQTDIVAYTRSASGRRWIELARAELARYEKLTRVAYPYPALRIAESSAGLAMEAPALIWIPGARSAADHPFLISHETAHQWWYGIVGNDQARSAFADEAMADYFSRKARSGLRASRCARDRLDRDIRAYSSSCYFEVIYIQGGGFLEGLRRDYGERRFKRAVRAYTKAYRLGIGGNRQLLEAFRAEMGNGVLKRFRARFPSLY